MIGATVSERQAGRKVYVVSHTHWDREWYLSQKQFQFLLGDILNGIILTLEREPDFRTFIADGQTSIIGDFLEIRPDSKEALLALIRQERIRVGPWYTMPDLWLPDGESLIRNLLVGRAECKRYGADIPCIGYVPDSFGHIEQMPQILNGFGIKNYVFGRGEPLEKLSGKLEFEWMAPDRKSSVTAHFLPGGYQNGAMLPSAREKEALGGAVESSIDIYAERSARPDLTLILNGVDHIWIQHDLPSILRELSQIFPDISFVHSSLEEYLREFSYDSPQLPRRSGVLRGPYLFAGLLEGTWSSRIDNKLENHRTSMVLRNWAEPLSALLQIQQGFGGRQEELKLGWRLLLQNHAHDSICGCSADRVHSDVNQRFRHAQEIGEMVTDVALHALANTFLKSQPMGIVRYSGMAGADGCEEILIDTSSESPIVLKGDGGRGIPAQSLGVRCLKRKDAVVVRGYSGGRGVQNTEIKTHEFWEHRVLARLPKGAPCSLQSYSWENGAVSPPVDDQVFVSADGMENQHLSVKVLDNGSLRVRHKKTGQIYERLLLLSDQADLGGGYSFLPLANDTPRISESCSARVSILESGPLRGCLQVEYPWKLPLGIDPAEARRMDEEGQCDWRMEIRLETSSETLLIRGWLVNRVRQHRIRLTLPLPFEANTCHAERAFVVSEETPMAYEADPGQNSHPMRNWLAVGNELGGVAFVGTGLHEWALENNILAVTLLRSVPFVGTCGSWETSDALLMRELSYEFALLFFSGNWREGDVPRRAARFLQPSAITQIKRVLPDWGNLPHASVQLEEVTPFGTREVSSWRNHWLRHFNRRDGWRRDEAAQSDVNFALLTMEPLRWEDADILLSAFKLHECSMGLILRFYSLSNVQKRVALTIALPLARVDLVNLAEELQESLEVENGVVTLDFPPFGIVTLQLTLTSDSCELTKRKV